MRLWHFWSEPAQRKVFSDLIHEFEKSNPDVHVELTELSWADGKAKLQTAFASGDVPDIIHLGLEWTQEFATAGVLLTLPDSVVSQIPKALRHSVTSNNTVIALPWVMNTRALFVRNDVLQKISTLHHGSGVLTMSDLFKVCSSMAPGAPFAFQAYEPHNVLKKVLPFLWSSGSKIFQSLPLHSSIDSAAVEALTLYSDEARRGRIDKSRSLDELLRRRELGVWLSGMWNISDSVIARSYSVLSTMPALRSQSPARGESVLSADCYSIAASSAHKEAALKVIQFLARPLTALRFCASIPDAGFPCVTVDKDSSPNANLYDSILSRPHAQAFLDQCQRSIALPSPPYFLDAERIFEEEVTEAMFGRKTASRALHDIRSRLISLEKQLNQ